MALQYEHLAHFSLQIDKAILQYASMHHKSVFDEDGQEEIGYLNHSKEALILALQTILERNRILLDTRAFWLTAKHFLYR
jgi:hypothetical protein